MSVRLLRLALLSALPLLLSACVLGQVGAVIHPTVSGSLIIHQTDGTDVHWTPDRCISGDLGYFLGFDFVSSQDQRTLRAWIDASSQPLAQWTTTQALPLRAGDCSKLEVVVQPTGWRVNEVRELAGHVELQCTTADGTRIEGRLAVDHCH